MMKLTYFNVRGLAETSRMLFALNNQNGDREEYEDFRYPLEVLDMIKYEMVKEEFDNDKKEGKLIQSLNKVPFLEIEGQVIPQSKAIERFLAKRFGMIGDNDLEAARIDSICECVRDFKDMYQKVRSADPDKKDSEMHQWFTITLVERLTLLENLLGDDGFSVGTKLSLSDVVLYSFITSFFDNKEASMNATLIAPRLRKVVDRVGNEPLMVEWLEKRPQTDF